jgi:hypothetical protein
MNISYRPGLPMEVRIAVEEHLTKWAHVVPAWCLELNVIWDDDNTSAAASMTVHYEYRRSDLKIFPNFLTCADLRERNILHELLHIVTEPMYNTMKDLKGVVADKHPEMKAWAEENMRMAVEMVTCDLTAALLHQLALLPLLHQSEWVISGADTAGPVSLRREPR